MTHDDILELDERYVKKEKCAEYRQQASAENKALEISVAKLVTKLNVVIGILTAIGTAILGVCVKLLFGV